MSGFESKNEKSLALARHYVKELEAGNWDSAEEALTELTGIRERQIYTELEKLKGDFHEVLQHFNTDETILAFVQDELPDAKKRLLYVIEKTDKAANTTLSAVDSADLVCEKMQKSLDVLIPEWKKFLNRELTAHEFRILSEMIRHFFETSNKDILEVKNQFTEILMAQEFQDITGQIIKRVIDLVSEVENSLVKIIPISGKHQLSIAGVSTQTDNKQKSEADLHTTLDGPQIPGMETKGSLGGQDDVDDLLSELGI